MDKGEALTHLESIKTAMHQQFGETDDLHRGRLAQLDHALATAAMAIEHLVDEDVRHRHDPKAHLKAIGAYQRED